MSTFTAAGQTWAAEIFWQTGSHGMARAEVVRKASQIAKTDKSGGTSLVLIRRTNPLEFGLGGSRDGHAAGMASAAAVLADCLPGNWVGAFEVPEGWFYTEVRNGVVSPKGGDRIFPENALAQVKDAIAKAVADGRLETVYAPASFNLDGTTELRFEEIVGKAKAAVLSRNRLTDIDRGRRARLPWKGLAAVAAATAATIVVLFNTVFAPPPPPPPAPVTPPWEREINGIGLMTACDSATMGFPHLAGFGLRTAICSAGSIRYTYAQHQRSAIAWLAQTPLPQGCTGDSNDRGEFVLTCSLSPVPPLGHQVPGAGATVKRLLAERMSGMGVEVKISAQPNGALNVTFTGAYPPADLVSEVKDIPAFTVTTVQMDMPPKWTISGRIYVH